MPNSWRGMPREEPSEREGARTSHQSPTQLMRKRQRVAGVGALTFDILRLEVGG